MSKLTNSIGALFVDEASTSGRVVSVHNPTLGAFRTVKSLSKLCHKFLFGRFFPVGLPEEAVHTDERNAEYGGQLRSSGGLGSLSCGGYIQALEL